MKTMQLGGKTVLIFESNQCRRSTETKRVWTTGEEFENCPFCGEALSKNTVKTFPVDKNMLVKCTLSTCYFCKVYFTTDAIVMKDLAKKCIDKRMLEIHTDFETGMNVKTSLLMSTLKTVAYQFILSSRKEIQRLYIVTDRREANAENHVYHYSSDVALDLLTMYVLNHRTVSVNGESYVYQFNHSYPAANDRLSVMDVDIPVYVNTKKNGGYYCTDSSIINLDGLCFSERTKRLEILPVSLNTETHEYYVDGLVFNAFREKYGFPIINYNDYIRFYDSMRNNESILHMLGYNVSTNDNLTDGERHAILCFAVDYNLMTVRDIRNLLHLLIHRNGKRSHNSKLIWEADDEYISNYHLDHERFIFVQSIRRVNTQKRSEL